MIIEQKQWKKVQGWKDIGSQNVGQKANLVLAFGSTAQVKNLETYKQLLSWYPKAEIVLGSSAGEILGANVSDDTVVVTAISFKDTVIKTFKAEINTFEESYDVGLQLSKKISTEGLVHVMIFTDGLKVNGSKFIAGLQESVLKNISITGGFAGDGMDFKETALGLNDSAKSGNIIAVGFYGNSLKVGYGSLGGWDSFGVERIITKSHDNILYEMDGKPALPLFKEYLGEKAKDLPASGLLFPLNIRIKTHSGKEVNIVRSFLKVDEETQSITFFADVPEGVPARLMKANFDRLIEASGGAATMSLVGLDNNKPELAILVPCIGRKAVLKERTEEELDEVKNIIGDQAVMAGFYGYGEFCPSDPNEKRCHIHNQTMTLTTFKEI
jgi:hypothetical protein